MSIRGWRQRAVVGLASVFLGAASLIAVGLGGAAVSAGAASPRLAMSSMSFPDTTLGTYSTSASPSVLSNSDSTDTIDLNTDVSFSGPGAADYLPLPGNCPGDGVSTIVLQSGQSCTPVIEFFPGALGDRSATMTIQGSADASPLSVSLTGTGTVGYYEVDSYGDVAPEGDASYYGDTGSLNLNYPIVGMAATGDNGGYWLVAADGGIFTFGDAGFFGSTGAIHLNQPIVGMAATRDGGGYGMVASDGGIFTFGDAAFYGSTGALHLNQPIVGMAATPDDGGYWLVAADGGIFSFGDAAFYGSTGALHLNQPIVGMAATPDGAGYWLVASDGGIFSFGDARFYGSAGAIHLNEPIAAMAPMPTGGGYWFAAADGGLFSYGDAPFYGSEAGTGLGQVVDIVTDGEPTQQAQADSPAIRAHLAGLGTSGLRGVQRFAGS
jgi:hypothetical protein